MRNIFLVVILLCSLLYSENFVESDLFYGYRSLESFQQDTPNVIDSTVLVDTVTGMEEIDDPSVSLRYEKRGRIRNYNPRIWGFKQGETVYIRVSSLFNSRNEFRQLHLRESFSFYSELSFSSPLSSGNAFVEPSSTETWYFIDMENGQTFLLTRAYLRQVLREFDFELYQLYLSESDDSSNIKYLEELNRRLSEN